MADVKNLSDFYTTLRTKGVKLNHQFQMTIIPQSNLVDSGVVTALQDVTMFAEGSSLPGRTLKNAPISYMGYEMTVPTVADMTKELSLTIKCDRDMDIRDACLSWLASHSRLNVDNALENGGGQKNIPTSKIILSLLDEDMQSISHEYHLYGVYPTNVGDVALTNAEPEIMSFELALSFQYWDDPAAAGA
jgi:hypothetical protein